MNWTAKQIKELYKTWLESDFLPRDRRSIEGLGSEMGFEAGFKKGYDAAVAEQEDREYQDAIMQSVHGD